MTVLPQPLPTAGLGLKAAHYDAALACGPADAPGLWFEVHPENYLAAGGPRIAWLEAVRARHPVSLHGVSMSLAAAGPLDAAHLARFAALVRRIAPVLVSEHLAWSAWDGHHLPDLLPFPRTTEALQRTAAHVAEMQDALGRSIAIENPSHYLRFPEGAHAWDEIDFLAELVRRTGCGLLLDINNVHVSARNLNTDPVAYLDRFPADAVMEIHLAGHSEDPQHGPTLLIDSHDAPVAAAVWSLYRHFVQRAGARPTLIERDGNVPAFEALLAERAQAHAVLCGLAATHDSPRLLAA